MNKMDKINKCIDCPYYVKDKECNVDDILNDDIWLFCLRDDVYYQLYVKEE